MTTFRIPQAGGWKPESPEDLFRSLNRDHSVQHLYLHQGDLLREYVKHERDPNVAIELPTGAGKTLIGLLIGEYRRRVYGEPVCYLCPTRQLARQVWEQSRRYGIPGVLLVGDQRQYPPSEYSDYLSAKAVCITTYSSIFNVNPRLDRSGFIILDDAHAADTYICGLWSLLVDRERHPQVYFPLAQLFFGDIPDWLRYQIEAEDGPDVVASPGMVYPPSVMEKSDQIRSILSAAPEEYRLGYAWSMIDSHIGACMMYVSRHEILLRPLFPPSLEHRPFSQARQRLFMSATLGGSGDLERSTGIPEIVRLPMPSGWGRRGTGRRLILFPNASMSDADSVAATSRVVAAVPRVLILTTDRRRAERIEAELLSASGKQVLRAHDVESDLSVFTGNPSAALLLTYRFDGIDLPDDACRLIVIDDLPDAAGLQESFFSDRLGASALLRERVRTRLTQAMGRCTRNDRDYCVIVIMGSRLTKFLMDLNVRRALHPELQAELGFGLSNSSDLNLDGLVSLFSQFRSAAWTRVEEYLLAERDRLVAHSDPISDVLRDSVAEEIRYLYSAWNGDWSGALGSARGVCDKLEGGRELRPYAALWYLLSGAAEAMLRRDGEARSAALEADLLDRAMRCAPPLRMFLPRANASVVASGEGDEFSERALQSVARSLCKMGFHGKRFHSEMGAFIQKLEDNSATSFQQGLDQLGRLLGFEVMVGIAHQKLAPDSVWHVDRELLIVWEAKSEESADGAISAKTIQQAAGQVSWVREELKLSDKARIISVIVSPRMEVDDAAVRYARDIKYFGVSDVRALGRAVCAALHDVRIRSGEAGESEVVERARVAYGAKHLLVSQILERIRLVSSLPVRGK